MTLGGGTGLNFQRCLLGFRRHDPHHGPRIEPVDMVVDMLFPDLAVVFVDQPLKPIQDQGFVEVRSMAGVVNIAMDDKPARHQIR